MATLDLPSVLVPPVGLAFPAIAMAFSFARMEGSEIA
uniref:Photosystem I reaction center subunit VIII n=1 Tax=Selaginella kraussiana TaxID=81964 RepID=A0A3T0IAS3_9TRAC|nr:photosystem I subunit I [Selaginella kraussiana]AZU95788.1 photosystem I subunit I [Selaginella kraussiana]